MSAAGWYGGMRHLVMLEFGRPFGGQMFRSLQCFGNDRPVPPPNGGTRSWWRTDPTRIAPGALDMKGHGVPNLEMLQSVPLAPPSWRRGGGPSAAVLARLK